MWPMGEQDSFSSARMAAPTHKYPLRPDFCSCGRMKPRPPTGSMRQPNSSITEFPGLNVEIDRTRGPHQRAGEVEPEERFMITRRDLITVSAAGAAFSALAHVPPGTAQSLARTVHVLSGFTPGTQDAMARLITGLMTDYAVSIVVEPRPGASGRIAV